MQVIKGGWVQLEDHEKEATGLGVKFRRKQIFEAFEYVLMKWESVNVTLTRLERNMAVERDMEGYASYKTVLEHEEEGDKQTAIKNVAYEIGELAAGELIERFIYDIPGAGLPTAVSAAIERE